MIIIYVSLVVLAATALTMMVRLLWSLRRYRAPARREVSLKTPSVSVCIPARNEMHALTDCLEKVLASTYPKLEVIVYDDESQDETPTIIKSFAHDGVRFVSGEKLPDDWLGRNYALETLSREASGTFIVFMDVDTGIRPETIGELVGAMISSDVDMMSVLPRREDVQRASVWLGTLRYFWQLVNIFSRRAPISTSLWVMKREVLLERGGLTDQKASIEPEGDIATLLGDRYRYVIGSMSFGVSFEKKWHSQIDTGRRLLFLQHGLSGLAMLVFLNLPTVIIVSAVMTGWNMAASAAIFVCFLFVIMYAMYLKVAWVRYWLPGALLWPYVILQELIVIIMSLWDYTRGVVIWKRRAVRLR